MVRDHGGDELLVSYEGLDAGRREGGREQDYQADMYESVQPLVPVHAAHGRKHDDAHRRNHRQRHIEHVEVIPEVAPSVDHREHHEVHDNEAKEHADGEHRVGMPAHALVLTMVVMLHTGSLWPSDAG